MAAGLILLVFSLVNQLALGQTSVTRTDTASSFRPAEIFAPVFYTSSGNAQHAANGEPGPAYWQNRSDYQINAVARHGSGYADSVRTYNLYQ